MTAALGRFGFLALGSFIRKSSEATINTPIATYWVRHGSNDPGESGSSGSFISTNALLSGGAERLVSA